MNGFRRELTGKRVPVGSKRPTDTMPIVPNVPGVVTPPTADPLPVNHRDHQINYGIIEDALDEMMYRPRFSPSTLIPSAGAALGTLYMAYPKAGTPAARLSIPLPTAYWVNGTLTARIIWTGDTASTNNVEWCFNAFLTAVNGVPTAITGPVVDLAGPSVVSALLAYTFTTTAFAVNSSHIHLVVNIFRQAAAGTDTYAGEARLYGLQLLYTPSGGH